MLAELLDGYGALVNVVPVGDVDRWLQLHPDWRARVRDGRPTTVVELELTLVRALFAADALAAAIIAAAPHDRIESACATYLDARCIQ